MRTREQALDHPLPGDRWHKGETDIIVDRWDGETGVLTQTGLMSEMLFYSWRDNFIDKFREWMVDAKFLGGAE